MPAGWTKGCEKETERRIGGPPPNNLTWYVGRGGVGKQQREVRVFVFMKRQADEPLIERKGGAPRSEQMRQRNDVECFCMVHTFRELWRASTNRLLVSTADCP